MEIVVKHRMPPFNALLQKVDPVIGPGAVDQGIDLSPLFFQSFYHLLSSLSLGYVALER